MTPISPARPAVLMLDSWAGRQQIPCTITGETPTRYQIRLDRAALLPSRRQAQAGDLVRVPRRAVKEAQP